MFVGGSTRSVVPFFIGLLIMFIGSLFSWIGSFFAYGFGELIDKATEIEKNIHVHSDGSKVDIIKEEQQKDTNNQPQESHNIKSSNMPFGDFGKVEY